MTYDEFVARLAALAGCSATTPAFVTLLPKFIEDSELRIARDLDLLNSRAREQTTFGSDTVVVANNAYLQMPADFIILRQLGFYTPVGTTTTYVPLDERDEGWCRELYRSLSTSSTPKYYAPLSARQILVVPTPNAAYTVEAAGTTRATVLSNSTSPSYISQWFPDLMVAAAMVVVAAYQKNFGAAVDDPKMATTWDATYKGLLASAATEEGRKKYAQYADVSQAMPPKATPAA